MSQYDKKNIEDVFTLTSLQEGILFLYLNAQQEDFYFEQLCLEVSGFIDIKTFEQAWNFVIAANEMLRAVFRWEKVERPVQIILKEHKLQTRYYDFSGKESRQKKKSIEHIKVKDRNEKFDLLQVPFRVTLCKVEKDYYVMIISNHHILYDGWSNGIILKEFFETYDLLCKKEPSPFPVNLENTKTKFKEFIRWTQIHTPGKHEQENYWEGYLNGFVAYNSIPVLVNGFINGKNRIEIQTGREEREIFTLPAAADFAEGVRHFTEEQKVTAACFFYSAWGILLQKYTGGHDVIFGTTVSLRNARLKGMGNMVGLFVNTLPFRIKSPGDDTLCQLLHDVNLSLQERDRFANTSLAEIKKISGIQGREGLFDTLVVVENYPLSDYLVHTRGSLSVHSYSIFDTTDFDLTLDIVTGGSLEIKFTYNPAAFPREFIESLGQHLGNIVDEMIILNNSNNLEKKKIQDVDMLGEDEKKQILVDFNNNRADFSRDKTIFQWLERYAQIYPHRIALISRRSNTGAHHLTYLELDKKSHQLACLLRSKGVFFNNITGILMERSLEMVVSIVAVWKAGGAYMPLDLQYPLQRLIGILEDSGANHLIVQLANTSVELEGTYRGMIINPEQNGPGAGGVNKVESKMDMKGLAYVIYTSGSTGAPKGVMIEHIGMMNHVQAKINDLQLSETSIIAQNASQCFDISVWQFFAALTVGGQTVIYANPLILDPAQFISWLVKDRVTILEVVPSYLSVMLEDSGEQQIHHLPLPFDFLLVTGEEIKTDLVRKWFEKYPFIKMVNAYGPTEASDDITHHIMDRAPGTPRIPIGKPIQNLNIYIVDEYMKLCPVGIKGEICVSGVGVGRGYLGDEEKTRQVFMADHFVNKKEKPVRLYKTGDLGFWLPGGTIVFSGRKDHQVKIKGFRIEPGEIEEQLLGHESVKDAVVIVRQDESGDLYLCGYVVADSPWELRPAQLKEYLSRRLPHYMIPAVLVQIEKMPLTATGKIDRKALPVPESGSHETDATYKAPRDKTEADLVTIWSKILAVPEEIIGIDDDFFARGGHSLKVTILAARIHKAFNIKIPPAEIFRLPTIRGLSQYIRGAAENRFLSIHAVEEKEYYPLSLSQRRLFVLEEIGGVNDAYNLPAVQLLEGRLDRGRFEKAFRELIRRHENLRTSFEYRNGKSVQIIHDYNLIDFHLDYKELQEIQKIHEIQGETRPGKEEIARIIEAFIKPFDLGKATLLRVGLIRFAPGKHLLLYDMHHIISDGVTIVVLARDLIRLYEGKKLPELRIRYKDFTAWQIRHFLSEEMKQQENYWLNRFMDGVPALNMKTDFPRPPVQRFEGASHSFQIGGELTAKIKQIVSRSGSTLYMVLLAAYTILLSKYTGREDIAVGLPIAGRNHADLEKIIGFFVNTLVMRNQPVGEKTVGRFIEEVKTTTLQAFENQNYPFEQLVNRLNIPRDLSRNPLFDVMFVLQNMDPLEEFEDLTVTPYEFERKISHFDLHLQAFPANDRIDMALEYSTVLFKRSTVEAMIENFIEVLEQMTEEENGEIKLKEIKTSSELASGNQYQKEKDYWQKQLSGEWVKGCFPYDFKQTGMKSLRSEGEEIHGPVKFNFKGELFSKLWQLSNHSHRELHMILSAALAVLAYKYTGNQDITVGVPIYKQDSEAVPVNTMLVIRNRLKAELTFRELILQVKETIVEANENRVYPVNKLVDLINPGARLEDFSLFDIVILLENIHDREYIRDSRPAIIFSFLRSDDMVAGVVEYNGVLYEKKSIERMTSHLGQLLANVFNNVDLTIDGIDILSGQERKQLLNDFNDTGAANRFPGTIHWLFQEQVRKTPGNVAISGAGTGTHTNVTYDELNRRSNRIARVLRKNGLTPGTVVGIMMEPGEQMLTALLAILKAGGAYLPIDVGLPKERVVYMLENSGARLLVTTSQDIKEIPFVSLQGFETPPDMHINIKVTPPRSHIKAFDRLPRPDRSFVNLQNYKNKIGMASVTDCISLQATRGCPYHCLYCHKIWSKHHVYRNPETLYDEIQYYYKQGVINFAFIDDCFNLNKEESSRLFQLIIDNKLKVQLFFPNGLRGDIMIPDYIDRMVEAGTRGINLSLETASPRLQALLKKNLDLEAFKNVMDYIAGQHPHVILEMATMHGFPGESEEEAMKTLDFIKSIKWLHFPYIHILKIFPNTEMEAFALEQGVSKADILLSRDRAFHELPETLPFPRSFTRKYQADFLNEYFLDKERLRQVLPYQMKVLSQTALAQKYNAYLPVEIKSIHDVIAFARLDNIDVPTDYDYDREKQTNKTIFDRAPGIREPAPGSQRILFLDLSQHFSSHRMLYRVVEQPLGAIYLLTYLKDRFGDKIDGRIYKSGIDFDSFARLKQLVDQYQPTLVGIRTLTFFKEFFHETVSMLRHWGIEAPIITGGPYASSDYDTILRDKHIDLVVFGEGEYTLGELIEEMQKNDFKLPEPEVLKKINGIAYVENSSPVSQSREIILLDRLADTIAGADSGNPQCVTGDSHLAYVMYTSGSTGKPKGVMVEHRQVNNCISWMQDKFALNQGDVVVNRTDLSFDPSVWELFWPLYIGASIRILDRFQRKDPGFLLRLMAEETGLTLMYCPATLITIMASLLSNDNETGTTLKLKLPWLLIGAEPIAMETIKTFYRFYEGKIVNTYGPTECTINNTYYDLDRNDRRQVVPIGKPVANNKIYIVDGNMRPKPLHVPGEICIAGASVSRGYINHREKTDLAFIKNPFGTGRIFRTGDIGRWLEDGNIEIMGRVDEQTKIRGYRIEPGEIENILSGHPAVNECVVIVRSGSQTNETIRTCLNCGITTGYPNVTINPAGICNICELYSRNRHYVDNYFKDSEQLKQIIKAAGNSRQETNKSEYDCLLLYSGGRGAAYALYHLVEWGFNVLALTYDNGYFGQAHLENLKKITSSLGVDHVILRHRHSDQILGESIKIISTVCRGCFHASSALAGEYAYHHGISVVIGATLSRGQIIENKLLMFLQQGITNESELETEIARMQRSVPDIDKNIFRHIDIREINDGSVYKQVTFVDFYRYCDVTNKEMIDWLNKKDSYWKTRKNYAVYSTNCPIKQMGDYGHLREKGYNYYGGATSWEVRLGHLDLENLKQDLTCRVTGSGYEKFLKRIGLTENKTVNKPGKYLCAYIVLKTLAGKEESKDLATDFREFLSKQLPVYMIPEYFVPLPEIPLKSNGKVDKKELPEPQRTRSQSSATYVAPQSQLEIIVANTWKKVLGIDMVGTRDNFFDLGGNSMDIIMVGSQLKETIKRDIPAVTLFTYPTIGSLAGHLDSGETGKEEETDRSRAIAGGKRRVRQSIQRRRGVV